MVDWCRPQQYICPNSKRCIDRIKICDGRNDCPYGDDERNCVALAQHLDAAEDMTYASSGNLLKSVWFDNPVAVLIADGFKGYLLVRKEGRWGKLCVNNADNVVDNLRQPFRIKDLGNAVCKQLTFKWFIFSFFHDSYSNLEGWSESMNEFAVHWKGSKRRQTCHVPAAAHRQIILKYSKDRLRATWPTWTRPLVCTTWVQSAPNAMWCTSAVVHLNVAFDPVTSSPIAPGNPLWNYP